MEQRRELTAEEKAEVAKVYADYGDHLRWFAGSLVLGAAAAVSSYLWCPAGKEGWVLAVSFFLGFSVLAGWQSKGILGVLISPVLVFSRIAKALQDIKKGREHLKKRFGDL